MDSTVTIGPLDRIKGVIDINSSKDDRFTNFLLEGGAGSGKTESLKEIIAYILENYPEKKVACITHTNVAVNEIISRIGNHKNIQVSTIHSLLNREIKKYKRNIKEIIHHIFIIESIDEINHDLYKKRYTKYSKLLYTIKKENISKVVDKRIYDKAPELYNKNLNDSIEILNDEVKKIIQGKDFDIIQYNDTRFDSFDELSFSHDSLLQISYLLAKKFNLFTKILSDKYDFILIDEYQDTNSNILELFLRLLPNTKKTTIGLFGDSMQAIYDNEIDLIQSYIERNEIIRIDKKDNYRCSEQVINFINHLRNDGIEQDLAFKIINGKKERKSQRQGNVNIYYHIYGKKPNTHSSLEDKANYQSSLNKLLDKCKNDINTNNEKTLVLTNKAISTELGFKSLYSVFDERYVEVREEIEKDLSTIQITDIAEMYKLYKAKQFNKLLVSLKKNGFQINSVGDKIEIVKYFEYLGNSEISLFDALKFAVNNNLVKKSEAHTIFENRKNDFLTAYSKNLLFILWEEKTKEGHSTLTRLKETLNIEISEIEYEDFLKSLKRKNFYLALFSEKVKFREVINYLSYLNEETKYITMHKTKGSGIENVVIVLDEYFWNKYNFKSIYDNSATTENNRIKNQKLFYVACSRAIKNLSIIRILTDTAEEALMKKHFRLNEGNWKNITELNN